MSKSIQSLNLNNRSYEHQGNFNKTSDDVFMKILTYFSPQEVSNFALVNRRFAVLSNHPISPLTYAEIRVQAWNAIIQSKPVVREYVSDNQFFRNSEQLIAYYTESERNQIHFWDTKTLQDLPSIKLPNHYHAYTHKFYPYRPLNERLAVFFGYPDPAVVIDIENAVEYARIDFSNQNMGQLIKVIGLENIDQPLFFITKKSVHIWDPKQKNFLQPIDFSLPDPYKDCNIDDVWIAGNYLYTKGIKLLKTDLIPGRAYTADLKIDHLFLTCVNLNDPSDHQILSPNYIDKHGNPNQISAFGDLLFNIDNQSVNNNVIVYKDGEIYNRLDLKNNKITNCICTNLGVFIAYRELPDDYNQRMDILVKNIIKDLKCLLWNPHNNKIDKIDIDPDTLDISVSNDELLLMYKRRSLDFYHLPSKNKFKIGSIQFDNKVFLGCAISSNSRDSITLIYRGSISTYLLPDVFRKKPQLRDPPKPIFSHIVKSAKIIPQMAVTQNLLGRRFRILRINLLRQLRRFFESLKKFFCCRRG